MSLLQALILGIVQGVTEYIPVSSSAHLVLVPWLVGWPLPPFTFDVLVQWGTLVGVVVYFGRDLWSVLRGSVVGVVNRQPLATPEARLGWYIVVGTIPAVVFGFLFKSTFEAVFQQPLYVAGLLFGTALMLVLAELRGRQTLQLKQMRLWDALDIGLWQVAAMLPGISRSGATITGAMLRDFDRPSAARFSFLLSVPALVGAGVLAIKDLLEAGVILDDLPALLIGFVAAAVSGYLSIRWLLGYLQRNRLTAFAGYCALFGAACLALALVRG